MWDMYAIKCVGSRDGDIPPTTCGICMPLSVWALGMVTYFCLLFRRLGLCLCFP